ncbi:hypothetical protein B9T16_30095 [Arthrospira sp. PCC 8006]
MLVLVPDRGLEGLLVLGRPVLAPCLQAVAAHGGEHGGGLLTPHDAEEDLQLNRIQTVDALR